MVWMVWGMAVAMHACAAGADNTARTDSGQLPAIPQRPFGAAVTWAHVSAEVDQRLRAADGERLTLAPSEWNSGEHTWLIDMAGEPRARAATLRKLNETVFGNKPVHVWTMNSSGEKKILMLGDILKRAGREGAAA